jgi:threonine dehydratase
VFLKLENTQVTGSFKLRGVLNKILSLPDGENTKTLVSASTGNHGAAFAYAVDRFGLEGRLFMPRTAAQIKLDAVRGSTITVELVGDDCVEAETHAHAFADDNDCVWISPYNDRDIVNGQGTTAVELLQQLGSIDVVLVPVGGGGLISGIAGYLKNVDPRIQVIGCQPTNSCVMYESIKAGRILEIESLPTMSDATAGGMEADSVTFDLCREYVDDFILLDEEEIIEAIRLIYHHEQMAVEGGAALAVAAVLQDRKRFAGQRAALIVTGSKIGEDTLRQIGCYET